MNKNRIGFIYPILGTFACIFLCSILWDLIKFNYSNPFDIIGEYSEYSHSIYNDSARYLVFILLPTITFFAIFYTVNKNNFYFSLNFKNIFLKNNTKKNQDLSLRLFIFFLVIIFIFFLIDDWNIQNQYLDIFEEGLSLSGATNSYFGKKAWADIYINTGLFYDILNAKIAWFITGYKSVGAFKFYIKFLNFISNLLLIYLLFNLSKQITEQKIRSIFFLLIGTIALFINLNNDYIFRDIPIILFLISILGFLNTKKTLYIISLSFLSIFSLFWSLDKGFYLNLTLLAFIFFTLLIDKKIFFKNILFLSFFWFIFIFIIGISDFLNFFNHTKEIFTTHEYFNGLIHPQPFSKDPDAARASKSLILILTNLIISILFFFSERKYFSNNSKFFFIFFSLLNFLTYKSALSRSDGGHIQVSSYFTILLFTFFLFFLFFNFLSKKGFFDKKKLFRNYFYISIIIFFVFFNNIKYIKNIYYFPKNIFIFIKSSDEKFINNEYKNLVNELKIILKNKNCLQAFSYDQAIFYLVEKQSCSKFFNSYIIGSKKNQLMYIEELKSNKPEYILVEGPIKFQNLNDRYTDISNFIYNEYYLYKEVHSWKILKKDW